MSAFEKVGLAAAVALAAFSGFAETPDYFVEWVQPSEANLYVDTGVRGKTGVKAELKATNVSCGEYPVLLGSWGGQGEGRRFNLVMNKNEQARWEYGSYQYADLGYFCWYGGDFTVQVICTAGGAMSSTWTNNRGDSIV